MVVNEITCTGMHLLYFQLFLLAEVFTRDDNLYVRLIIDSWCMAFWLMLVNDDLVAKKQNATTEKFKMFLQSFIIARREIFEIQEIIFFLNS